MKKILLSLGMIVFVGGVVAGATGAFFSDSEVSTGNTLSAGAIDLGIDNQSYYNGHLNPETTWSVDYDIDGGEDQINGPAVRQFFNFDDIKPGDWGEDTISLHVNNNDSWLCADVTLTSDDDNDCTEPENDVEGSNCPLDGSEPDSDNADGDLADKINFYWWADDGDNVLETCRLFEDPQQIEACILSGGEETLLPSGPLGAIPVGATSTVALADSDENIWTNQSGDPLDGDDFRFVGKAWCFGSSAMKPYRQDGGNQQNGPDERPVICDGSGEGNASQTDSLTATIAFRAVQSRNNLRFQCQQTP